MINQPWASRNWFTYNNAYTSGTNDILLNLSPTSFTTFNLNNVTEWSVSEIGGDTAKERWGWTAGQTRGILTIRLSTGEKHTLYDDPQENIFQIDDFFVAMEQARLM